MTTIIGKWNWQRKSIEVHPIFWDDCKFKDGAELTSVLSADRNPDQLKAYWAIIGDIIASGAYDGDKDALDDFTREFTGFGKWRALSDGRAVFIPNSIAISKCEGAKFNRFMFFAEKLWAERLGVDVEAIKREASSSSQREAA